MANKPLKSIKFPNLPDTYTIDGFTEEIKQALLQLASKVAYIDDDGQTYYNDLYDALYPSKTLESISAVYTQSGTVYDTDSLDSLKADLVVTANYDDSTTETITNYVLSGTLTAGTSTITVSYGGKNTTFNVTVSSKTIKLLTNSDFVIGTIQNTYQGSGYGGYIQISSATENRMGYPYFDIPTEAGHSYKIEVDWNKNYDLYMFYLTYYNDTLERVENHQQLASPISTNFVQLSSNDGVFTLTDQYSSAIRVSFKIGSAGTEKFNSANTYINSLKVTRLD